MVVLRSERLPELGHGAGVEKMCRGADSGGTGDDHARSRARAARARRRRNNALRAVIVMAAAIDATPASVKRARAHPRSQASCATLFQPRQNARRAIEMLRSLDSRAPESRDS